MYLGLVTTKTETPGTGNAYGLIPRSSDKSYVERGKVSATVKRDFGLWDMPSPTDM